MILNLEPQDKNLQSEALTSWLYQPGDHNGPVSLERIEPHSTIITVTWQTRYHFQRYTYGQFNLN